MILFLSTLMNVSKCLNDKEYIVLGPDKYCPLFEFEKRWKVYCEENGWSCKKFTPELIADAFREQNLRVVTCTKQYRDKTLHADFVLGADVIDFGSRWSRMD